MSSDSSSFYGGGLHPQSPPRARSLSEARYLTARGKPFMVQPGSSEHAFIEAPQAQIAHSKQTVWMQLFGKSTSGESTKYTELFGKMSLDHLTRANKTLVRGGSDSISPATNTWHGKSYTTSAMTSATLLRLNETITAFGTEAMGTPTHDVGTGMMAQALSEKWSAKSQAQSQDKAWDSSKFDMSALLTRMTKRFPQLDTVDKFRAMGKDPMKQQTPEEVEAETDRIMQQQIVGSRMEAAIAAGQRWLDKGKSFGEIGDYVQRKFAKHGLGAPPQGWADALRQRHQSSTM
jgi:hypothetical protein